MNTQVLRGTGTLRPCQQTSELQVQTGEETEPTWGSGRPDAARSSTHRGNNSKWKNARDVFFVGLDLNHDLREQLEQAKSMFGASATKTREGELNFKKLRSLLVGLHVGKMNSQFNLKLSCADKETAQILHKLIEANQAHLIKGTDKIIQNGNITSSTTGSETLFSLKLNQSQLDSLKKQFKPMFKQFNPEKASTEAKEEAADLSP